MEEEKKREQCTRVEREVVYWRRRVCFFVVVRGKQHTYVLGALYAWLKRGVSRAAVTVLSERHYGSVASTILRPAQLRTVLLWHRCVEPLAERDTASSEWKKEMPAKKTPGCSKLLRNKNGHVVYVS